MYAARLAAALKGRLDVELFGMGGPQMRAAGVEIVTDYSEVAVVGITEIVKHLPSLLRAMGRLVEAAEKRLAKVVTAGRVTGADRAWLVLTARLLMASVF